MRFGEGGNALFEDESVEEAEVEDEEEKEEGGEEEAVDDGDGKASE